ncbi:MAG: hypothetical protein WD768_18595 [Phycisphaeraceae bacterium]
MFRSSFFTVICSALALTVTSALVAAPPAPIDAPKPIVADEAMTQGKIMSVNMDKHEFVLKTEQDREVTVKFDEKTTFWVDGKEAQASEALKADASAKVLHKKGLAMKVDILKES